MKHIGQSLFIIISILDGLGPKIINMLLRNRKCLPFFIHMCKII